MPISIYRPAITVGDATTGETAKFDGPYYLLTLLRSQPGVAIAPVGIGGPYEMNLVPRDYVVDALARLGTDPDTIGEVYQLCDPAPPTVRDIISAFAAALGKRVWKIPLPTRSIRRWLSVLPGVGNALPVEPAALDYLTHPTQYVTPNTRRVLGGDGPPAFEEYVETLVEWAVTHDRPARAMA